MVQGGAPAGRGRLHRRRPRPARLRRLVQAAGRRRTMSTIPSAPWRRIRSRSCVPLGSSASPWSAMTGAAGWRTAWRWTIRTMSSVWPCSTSRPRPRCTTRTEPGIRDEVFLVVLPDPAVRPAGAPDRRRPGILPAAAHRRPDEKRRCRQRGAVPGIPALLPRSRDDPRHLRGLPRRRVDRPGTRCRRCRPQGRRRRCWPCGAPRAWSGSLYDVLETWREKAVNVSGRALDCGHTLQEELPDETAAELLSFLRN